MILGIMQPYFFPYLGYYQLISKSDMWIVFDVVQYNSKSWMTRNRILHPSGGWQYINVPVRKSPHGSPIREISVVNLSDTLARITGQVNHYKKHAPYFTRVIELINKVFNETATNRLVDLNISTLSVICEYLKIQFDFSFCSDLNLDLSSIEDAGDWALSISNQLGATDYINPSGGEKLFKPDDWLRCGINLHIYDPPVFEYICTPYDYVSNLSIIDVLMWNDPVEIKKVFVESHPKHTYMSRDMRG